MNTVPTDTQTSAGHRPHPTRRFATALSIILAAVIVGAAVLVVTKFQSAGTPRVSSSAPPAGWHVYRDPGGYFSIQIPDDWETITTHGTGIQGITGADSMQTTTIDTTFRQQDGPDPATRLFVSISYTTFADAGTGTDQQRILCSVYTASKTTLAGLRAEQLAGRFRNQAWLVSTRDALYQVSYGVPADFDGSLQTTPPTPVPTATITARQQEASAIIATFAPTPAQPPACS